MNLEREEWATVLRLLDQALDLPAAERSSWLDTLAFDPPYLKTALRRLLEDRCAVETADFLGAGAREPVDLQAGAMVGPWRLLRALGDGGMASVWLAERHDGAHQRPVALKLPYAGPRARVIAARFARERAILSTLNHPHIAQILDAGTDGGQAWLAMEFVDGTPVTTYATDHNLDLRARLRLFGPVLRAVQHAHAQLVIHRDLKPSNVMVGTDGSVKLLDFGVAKLLEADGAAAQTALTQLGGRAMTPQYASPEQVAGRPLGVASDVYSLGVLLYELLTGKLPYRLQRDTPAALEEAILAAQVVAPSAAVADRSTARALRGDVDTIVLKALATDPAQRYASAAALADDLERHLQAQPIRARRASLGYRWRRALVRHRIAFGFGGALAVALLAGLATTVWQAERARQEAVRAQAVQHFLVDLLQAADPQRGHARDLTAGELLDLAALRIDAEFRDRPDVQARLFHTVANIYVERSEPAKGRPLLERAIALYAAAGPSGREAHVQALVDLGELLDELDDNDAERATIARATELAERHFGRPNRWSAQLLANLSWVEMKAGHLDEARRLGEQAQQRFGAPTVQSLRTTGSLATIYMSLGDLVTARRLLEQAERDGRTVPGQGTIDRLMAGYNLARVRYIQGDYAQAEVALLNLLPQFDAIGGRAHDRTLMARGLLAQTLAERGRIDLAVSEARAGLADVEGRADRSGDQVDAQRAILARMLRLAGDADQGLPLARAALAQTERKYPQPTSQREAMRRVLAELQLANAQRGEGIESLDTALGHLRTLATGGQELLAPEIRLMLALALRETPRRDESGPLMAQACAAIAVQRPADSLPLLRCRAVQTWLAAGAAPAGERSGALREFQVARERLFSAGLHERHPLRAELVAAEAEVLAADPARQGESPALFAQADALYRDILGHPVPRPLLVLH